MFIAVTVIICNKQQQNYRSTCKLHLNYKLYNTLNMVEVITSNVKHIIGHIGDGFKGQ